MNNSDDSNYMRTKVWDTDRSCAECGHVYIHADPARYDMTTKDAEYFGGMKPCLYCDNPHLNYKKQSSGCAGLFVFLALLALSLARF